MSVVVKEHEVIPFAEHQYLHEWADNSRRRPDLSQSEILGLHKTTNGIAPGNFIGAVWIGAGKENKATPLIVKPKFQEMDYMSMYLSCAEDLQCDNLSGCFYFWPDKQPIEAKELSKLNKLLIAAFLYELHKFCTQHLRNHFNKKKDNLRGKIKGKILLSLHAKKNLSHGREDRVFCSYQVVNKDILENRVLRSALERASKLINAKGEHSSLLFRWVHSSRSMLASVPVTTIKTKDFRYLRVNGLFSHYRRVLNLAKFILFRLGTDPHAKAKESTSTPPFAINSARLFECYVGKVLREKEAYHQLKSNPNPKQNTKGDPDGLEIEIRPDFHVPKDEEGIGRIIDAKYKRVSDDDLKGDVSQKDIYQMVAYSRHSNFLENKLGHPNADKIELTLVYPGFEQEKKIKEYREDKSFLAPIKICFVKCPKYDSST